MITGARTNDKYSEIHNLPNEISIVPRQLCLIYTLLRGRGVGDRSSHPFLPFSWHNFWNIPGWTFWSPNACSSAPFPAPSHYSWLASSPSSLRLSTKTSLLWTPLPLTTLLSLWLSSPLYLQLHSPCTSQKGNYIDKQIFLSDYIFMRFFSLPLVF